jgi:hypothetical protein
MRPRVLSFIRNIYETYYFVSLAADSVMVVGVWFGVAFTDGL